VNKVAERLALYCDDLEAAEGRKWRTRLEKEAEKETGGGALGGDSRSIAIQGSSIVDQSTFKKTHKDRLQSPPVEA